MCRVERYDFKKHGHVDDCDYVVVLSKPYTLEQLDLAELIAMKINNSFSVSSEYDDEVRFYCCHA